MVGLLLFFVLAELVLIVALVGRWRAHVGGARQESLLDDEAIRRIETEGRIEIEEGLDLDRIDQEERRFWNQYWDEPDEF